jgi:hypothetical protein
VVSKGADHEIAQRLVEYDRPAPRTIDSLSPASIRMIPPGNHGLVFAVAGDQESHTENGISRERKGEGESDDCEGEREVGDESKKIRQGVIG